MQQAGDRWKRTVTFILLAEAGVVALGLLSLRSPRSPRNGASHPVYTRRPDNVSPSTWGANNTAFEERATKILGTESTDFSQSALWRSDHEVLFLRSGRLISVDTRTGAQDEFPALQKLLLKGWAGAASPAVPSRVSPDGKWLLWAGGTSSRPLWIAATLDGAKTVERPRNVQPDSAVAWMADSRRWVELAWAYNDLHALVHSLDDLKTADIVIKSPGGALRPRGPDALAFAPGGEGLLAVAFASNSPSPIRSFSFVTFGIQKPVAPARSFRVPLPENVQVQGWSLSPRGDQIAWALYQFPRAFAPYGGSSGGYGGPVTSVWVGPREGGLRKISPDVSWHDLNRNLHWTRDAERVGVWYRHALYTLPVPSPAQAESSRPGQNPNGPLTVRPIRGTGNDDISGRHVWR